MGKVVADMTMSLDGFIAGANIRPELPMGENGERLHKWMFGATGINVEIIKEIFATQGAVILGKRTFDLGEPHWGGNTPFGTPSFVLTTTPRDKMVSAKGGVYTFISDGVESALAKAKEAAGDKDVLVMGGAYTVQQYIKAGLIDEMRVRISPVLLGQGVRLFDHIGSASIELDRTKVIEAPEVTHLIFRILK
jgi:dihydrofolate reductase